MDTRSNYTFNAYLYALKKLADSESWSLGENLTDSIILEALMKGKFRKTTSTYSERFYNNSQVKNRECEFLGEDLKETLIQIANEANVHINIDKNRINISCFESQKLIDFARFKLKEAMQYQTPPSKPEEVDMPVFCFIL